VGLLEAMAVTQLPSQEYDQIVLMIESLEGEEPGRLKPVYDALDGQYDYGVLKCVQAAL